MLNTINGFSVSKQSLFHSIEHPSYSLNVLEANGKLLEQSLHNWYRYLRRIEPIGIVITIVSCETFVFCTIKT